MSTKGKRRERSRARDMKYWAEPTWVPTDRASVGFRRFSGTRRSVESVESDLTDRLEYGTMSLPEVEEQVERD
jgi:hypothetical protein